MKTRPLHSSCGWHSHVVRSSMVERWAVDPKMTVQFCSDNQIRSYTVPREAATLTDGIGIGR